MIEFDGVTKEEAQEYFKKEKIHIESIDETDEDDILYILEKARRKHAYLQGGLMAIRCNQLQSIPYDSDRMKNIFKEYMAYNGLIVYLKKHLEEMRTKVEEEHDEEIAS